jgi:hypothetical protein
MMLGLIAFFVLVAGQQELAMVRYQNAMGRRAPLDVLPADDEAPAPHPVSPGFSGFVWDARTNHWIEWRNGRPVHAVAVEPE